MCKRTTVWSAPGLQKVVSNISLPASPTVKEALAILHRIKPSQRSVSRTKPKGFLGSALYYGKGLFTLLFLNGPPQNNPSSSSPPKLSPPLAKAVDLLNAAAVG